MICNVVPFGIANCVVHIQDVCVRVAYCWSLSIELKCAVRCVCDSDIELRNVWFTFDRFVDGNVVVSLLDDHDYLVE